MAKRKTILEEAIKCVTRDRNLEYDVPENNFGKISGLWTSYLGVPISPKDVALIMVLLKVARAHSSDKADNYIDIAGYAACAGEVTQDDICREVTI